MKVQIKGIEQDLNEIKGHNDQYSEEDPKNPFTVDRLSDDTYNVLNGMNLVASFLTDAFLDSVSDGAYDEILSDADFETVKKIIEAFGGYTFNAISCLIPPFIQASESWSRHEQVQTD